MNATRTMTLTTAAAAALLALTGCGGAAVQSATAEPRETSSVPAEPAEERQVSTDADSLYMTMLASGGVYADKDAAVTAGKAACEALDSGVPWQMVAAAAMDAGYDEDQTATIIAASVVSYCPWNESLFQ